MEKKTKFNEIFANGSKAQKMGVVLKKIIISHFDNIDENILGGAKVQLALYTRNGENNVLCGVQQGSNDTCMLYVHHVDSLEHERIKFSGKGKHAKRIKFESEEEILADDIIWLLSKVDENAPY